MNLNRTDPEFNKRFEYFAFDEVVNEPGQQLDEKTRYKAILAVLIGCGGKETYENMLPKALSEGVTEIAVKEIVYQAVAYMGIGRALPFLEATNRVMTEMSIALPLDGQESTTLQDRREKGAEIQAEIFGDDMLTAWQKSHVNRWLAENCFGDYYTRSGLSLQEREMITFCFLAGQGGCEPQLKAHALGNMRIGNDKDFLMRVISQCLPYIGYPRSLNAISCLESAVETMEGK